MLARELITARLPAVEVVEAADGAAALRSIEDRHFDCLVTDLAMPNLDGAGLLQEIFNRGLRMPVIVVSAYAGDAAPVRGVPRRIAKPADLRELCSVIEQVLSDPIFAAGATLTLGGLMQVLAWEQRGSTIDVSVKAGRGTMTVSRGRVSHARFRPTRPGPEVLGVDAAIEILSGEEGRILVTPDAVPPSGSRVDTVDVTLGQLLARAEARRRGRERAPASEG